MLTDCLDFEELGCDSSVINDSSTILQTKDTSTDCTKKNESYKQRKLLEGNPSNPGDFHHPDMILMRMKECDALNKYLGSIGVDDSFWIRAKDNKQDPWERLRNNDVNGQMRQFQINVKGSAP